MIHKKTHKKTSYGRKRKQAVDTKVVKAKKATEKKKKRPKSDYNKFVSRYFKAHKNDADLPVAALEKSRAILKMAAAAWKTSTDKTKASAKALARGKKLVRDAKKATTKAERTKVANEKKANTKKVQKCRKLKAILERALKHKNKLKTERAATSDNKRKAVLDKRISDLHDKGIETRQELRTCLSGMDRKDQMRLNKKKKAAPKAKKAAAKKPARAVKVTRKRGMKAGKKAGKKKVVKKKKAGKRGRPMRKRAISYLIGWNN